MVTRFLPATVLFLLLSAGLRAQDLHIHLGMNIGYSVLRHDAKFNVTPLQNQYEIIQEVKKRDGEEYTWAEFSDDFGLSNTFAQPRFGFSAIFTYRELPLFLIGEAMSSPSDYTKMSYGVTLALGKDFFTYDSTFFLTFMGGYKYVLDKGFGSSTMVNSVRDDYMRERLETFFDPAEPVDQQAASLFVLRAGVGHAFGRFHGMRVGIEGFGELDLTDKKNRLARMAMTNYGANVYMRFKLIGGRRSMAFRI